MAVLTVQRISPGGLAPSYSAAAAGGDRALAGVDVFVHVRVGSTPTTVTVDGAVPCTLGSEHDLVVAVPANGEAMVGPLTPGRYAGSDGLVRLTYSQVAGVSVAALGLRRGGGGVAIPAGYAGGYAGGYGGGL